MRCDAHFFRIGQKVTGQLADLFGHGRGKQNGLPRGFELAHDLTDCRHETEIQHLVGFIQHHGAHLVETQSPGLHMVDQAARRGDQEIDTRLEHLDLGARFYASENDRMAKREMLGIDRDIILDLGGKFTGWGEDQGAHIARSRALGVVLQAMQQG